MATLVATVAAIAAASVVISPAGGNAEDSPGKSAAVANAPDFTGPLPPAVDPAPDRWMQIGVHGDDSSAVFDRAVAALRIYGEIQELPVGIQERIASLASQDKITERHARYDSAFINPQYLAGIERGLALYAPDPTYNAFSSYRLTVVELQYEEDKLCPPVHSIVPPVTAGNISELTCGTAFVVFTGHEEYLLHATGQWDVNPLYQFQVRLRSTSSPGAPPTWMVEKFYAIPLEGEGAEAFIPSFTPSPIA